MPLDSAIIKFVIGSLNRERQRIAKHLKRAGVDERIVEGLIDTSEDVNVFRDNGHAVGLDDPITMRDMPNADDVE
jgi:hypothetical protein